jgi:hypothetical protein
LKKEIKICLADFELPKEKKMMKNIELIEFEFGKDGKPLLIY